MNAAPPRRSPVAIWAALFVVYVVWGSTYLGIAVAIETMPPLLMSGVRYGLAGAILFALAWRHRGERIGWTEWRSAAIAGGALFVIGNGGVAIAEQTVASGIVALLIASTPLWFALLGWLFYRDRLTSRAVVGLVIGFAGVAFLLNPSSVPGRLDVAGAVFALFAAVGWAAGSLYARSGPVATNSLLNAAMQMLAGGALLLIAGAARGEFRDVEPAAISARSIVAFVYLIFIGSLVAFTAYAWLLRNARTSLVATYAYVNPVVAVILGAAILDEQFGLRTLAAGAVILVAVALIVSAKPAEDASAEEEEAPPLRRAA